ncbi:hypothetical protein AAG570_010576 [Ranatra chinensis]|uniref:Chaoptin n=1 Tax=Ranatra chinensis TaxID=642074 RepID=A0ABD0YMY5_9HEMI
MQYPYNCFFLSARSNRIHTVAVDWRGLKQTLTNLYLGNNDISFLPLMPYLSMSGLERLAWLNLENNYITNVEANSVPFTLKTLSLSHNLLTGVPFDLMDNLKDLNALFLRGNYIETIPSNKFTTKKVLEKLDLGDNSIKTVMNIFSGSLIVKDLNLDSNGIKMIPANSFKGLNCQRINLSKNRIDIVSDRAFFGLSNYLEFIDLSNNKLHSISKGIKQLKKLKYLYLAGNKISTVSDESFANFSQSLRALSLSGNRLTQVPATSLKNLKKLNHLNLGYNKIEGPLGTNYVQWGESLNTLLLMGNKITRIKSGSFKNLNQVKELSLSFNDISQLDETCFEPMSKSLESLEISFGLKMAEFPEAALKPLSQLIWMALDWNEIKILTRTTLYSFGNLQYLNLDGNRITDVPEFFFHSSIHKNIRDIRLSFNQLHTLEPYTFSGLKELQSVVLSDNRITFINENAFQNLPNALTIVLSDNAITRIAPRAFANIPNLAKLDLHRNSLKDFSLGALKNVSNQMHPMTLNLSSNLITYLAPAETYYPVYIKAIDLRFNQLSKVPLHFLNAFNGSLRTLQLGYNKIQHLDDYLFEKFTNMDSLHLEHNGIVGLRQNTFHGLKNLQILDLSHNHIEQLHIQQFSLKNLRILDLRHNHLRSIPRDAFQSTRLERLILANNDFVVIPATPLIEISYTLRLLDLSNNQIEHLDTTMFTDTPLLTDLNLSNNKLTLLPDNVFRSVGSLVRLNFRGNKLRANFKELLHYLQRLRYLDLAETGLKFAPHLSLPRLISLNMSGNELDRIREPFLESVPKLRTLDISRNLFTNLSGIAWHMAPFISELDISRNPIKILTKDSFMGLDNLQTLNVQHLHDLQRFDSDSLSKCKHLKWLRIQTWPMIEKYRFRLSRILSTLNHLQRLSVMVTEVKLSDQFGEAFPPKLKTLEISGSKLRILDEGCLDGLDSSRELAIHIHDTKVKSFPKGFFAKFAKGGLSLDLRANLVENFGPELFYKYPTQWKEIGTKVISGGINVKDNPVVCSCKTKWLGEWMRRYLRESLQLHTMMLETNQQVVATMKEAICFHNVTGQRLPILTYDQPGCQISLAIRTQTNFGLIAAVIVIFFR